MNQLKGNGLLSVFLSVFPVKIGILKIHHSKQKYGTGKERESGKRGTQCKACGVLEL